MKQIQKFFGVVLDHVLEPALDWVIAHPIVTVVGVVALLYWAVRGYRTI